jgi:hypothetical protein
MLSDHAEALKKQKKASQSAVIVPKEKQTLEDISASLYKSYTSKKPLAIQIDMIKDGNYLPDTEGLVKGFRGSVVFIECRDRSIRQIRLEEIRNISWIDAASWFEKYQRQSVSY